MARLLYPTELTLRSALLVGLLRPAPASGVAGNWGCWVDGGESDGDAASSSRLAPPGDPEFTWLKTPEVAGECADDSGCVASCTHHCIATPTGPTTCPTDPPPVRASPMPRAAARKGGAWLGEHLDGTMIVQDSRPAARALDELPVRPRRLGR